VEPFKNLLNPALVRSSGQALARAWPAFDRRAFERRALGGLEALEMKARAMQIASALEAALPASFSAACDVIESALAPPIDVIEAGVSARRDVAAPGLTGWIVWPLGEFVARRGIDEPERALRALHALTQRLTSEFAIRPFIVAHPGLTLATLRRWTEDPSPHVRRLCSEGSRPRLPWGLRLRALAADPSPTLPILAALQDDPSDYVRRSVANHLNDIAKDHPETVLAWVRQHLPGAPPERRALLSHASRTLIKHGHKGMLALWGTGAAFEGRCALKLRPLRVRVGEHVKMTLTLQSSSATAQSLLIDYTVHHVKADGATSPKVFKGWKLALGSGEKVSLAKAHSFRAVTTRRYHAGAHRVEVSINGSVAATATVQLALTCR
jgi:3-methyladenine DNA glycosylase AlkC